MAVLNPFKVAIVAFKETVKSNKVEKAKKLLTENNYSVAKKPNKDTNK